MSCIYNRSGGDKDSANGKFWKEEEMDSELFFSRIVKLEELLARGSNDRVKLEKTINYLAKVVEDLQLEAEEEKKISVQPREQGEVNFGSTDVRLKRRKQQSKANLGDSTPVARFRRAKGQPVPAGKLGLEGGKSLSAGDLYKPSQQVQTSAEISEKSQKSEEEKYRRKFDINSMAATVDLLAASYAPVKYSPLSFNKDKQAERLKPVKRGDYHVGKSKSVFVEEFFCKQVNVGVDDDQLRRRPPRGARFNK